MKINIVCFIVWDDEQCIQEELDMLRVYIRRKTQTREFPRENFCLLNIFVGSRDKFIGQDFRDIFFFHSFIGYINLKIEVISIKFQGYFPYEIRRLSNLSKRF